MDKYVKNELHTLKNIILDTIPVKQIILFGSYAGGDPHKDSDLDIFVVMPESTNMREIVAMRLIHKAIRDKKTMLVDVIVSKKNKFLQRKSTPTIERQIAEEGLGLVFYG